MILRKDVQIVAYLINKRIKFNAFIHTVEIDEQGIDADTLFKLGMYETVKERERVYIKKNLTESETYKKNIRIHREDFKNVLKYVGLELISYEEYKKINEREIKPIVPSKPKRTMLRRPPVDVKKIAIIAERIDRENKPYQRPKSEYSNKQWDDYYKD